MSNLLHISGQELGIPGRVPCATAREAYKWPGSLSLQSLESIDKLAARIPIRKSMKLEE
jgi:hypothetical protein